MVSEIRFFRRRRRRRWTICENCVYLYFTSPVIFSSIFLHAVTFSHVLHLDVLRRQIELKLKVKIEISLCMAQERIRGGGGKERVTRASAKPGKIWRECYFWKSSTHLTSTTTGNHRTASIFSTAQGFRLHYRPYALLPEVTRSFPPPPASYALLMAIMQNHPLPSL